MAVKIGHAVMDEDGGILGINEGDNTGKEVAFSTWYAKNKKGVGWSFYIEAKSAELREGLARFIESACKNDGIGYSQPNRTGLEDALKKGASVDTAEGDVDCTSLIFIGLRACGLDVAIGYSGNMYQLLAKTGAFDIYTDADHLTTDKLAKRGGIYLRYGHALTVLEDGAGAINEEAEIDPPYVLVLGSVNVREQAGTDGRLIYTAHKGEKLPFGEIDDDTGWYAVETPKGLGFISNKPKYTKLVTA